MRPVVRLRKSKKDYGQRVDVKTEIYPESNKKPQREGHNLAS
jgi:hypothetical protein